MNESLPERGRVYNFLHRFEKGLVGGGSPGRRGADGDALTVEGRNFKPAGAASEISENIIPREAV